MEGKKVGILLTVGLLVGNLLGMVVTSLVGTFDGNLVVGEKLVGFFEDITLGNIDGLSEGTSVGE